MGMMINRRRVYGGKSLPYDAKIEYLESTGTQWIDTEFKATNGCIFDFEAAWTVYNDMIVGSHNPLSVPSNGYNRNMAGLTDSKRVFFNKCSIFQPLPFNNSIGVKYHIYYNSIGRNRIGSIDGNIIVEITDSQVVLNPINNIVFFLNQADSSVSSGRVYSCKLYDSSSTLVRDYIPVRVGHIGYLYDKVSGKLFGNQGTGDFILGPDV